MPNTPEERTLLLDRDISLHPENEDHSIELHKSIKETRILVTACCLTAFFFVVELVGGYYAGSLVVMSDAAHLASDMVGFLISLLAVAFARIPPSELMSFGFVRAEVLGAFVSLIFIWSLTIVLVVLAVARLFVPKPVNGKLMLILGAIGLAVNIALGVVLGHGAHSHLHDTHDDGHEDCNHAHVHHDHTHGARRPSHRDHDHGNDLENGDSDGSAVNWIDRLTGTDIESVNVRAAYVHVLGDAVQSIGVIIAASIIMIRPRWTVVDPLCTLFFACLVLLTTKGLAIQTLNVLMEATPPHISLRLVLERLRKVPGVIRVGDLHIWSISVNRPALSAHLFREMFATDHEVLDEARKMLRDEFGIAHSTIQVNCLEQCCNDKEHDQCLSTSELS